MCQGFSVQDRIKRVEVVAAALVEQGRLLATQRGYGVWKGWWEFPGGKIEAGESPQQALRRELAEELDMAVSIGNHIATVDYDYPDFHLTMHLYHCIPLGIYTLREHLAARWLLEDEVASVQWLPADLQVLPQVCAILRSNAL